MIGFLLALGGITAVALAAASSGSEGGGGESPASPPNPADEAYLSKLVPQAASVFRVVLAKLRAEGFSPKVVSGKRSCEEQRRIYQQGRTTPGAIVTKANGCKSWHVQGRAIDLWFPQGESIKGYKRAGELVEQLGGKWGGNFQGFVDMPHLEFHPGLTIEQVCPNADDCSNL